MKTTYEESKSKSNNQHRFDKGFLAADGTTSTVQLDHGLEHNGKECILMYDGHLKMNRIAVINPDGA